MVDAGPPLRIVFFGTPDFAVPTLEALFRSRHPVVGVVTQPDKARGRGHQLSPSPVKRLALAHDVPVLQPDRLRAPEFLDAVRAWQPDLGVVAAYGKILPEVLLSLPRHGMINVHASLLPKYRGAAPVHRAIIDGELETGVTIMRVERTLDSGPMLAKVRRPIGLRDTSDVVEEDLARLGADLLVRVVDQIAAGTAQEEPQDSTCCSYAPRLTKDEGLIDWTLPASHIHNRVRGLYPWPHAYTYLDGERLIILSTHVEETPADGEPGTIVAAAGESLEVATGHHGRIAIERLQREGRRPVSVREFLSGHRVEPGARFTGAS